MIDLKEKKFRRAFVLEKKMIIRRKKVDDNGNENLRK